MGNESSDPVDERDTRERCMFTRCEQEAQPGLEFDVDLHDGKPPIQIYACSQWHQRELMKWFLGFEAAPCQMSRKAMLALRRRATAPGSLYRGKPIFRYREWKNGGAWVRDHSAPGIWRAELVLAWRDPLAVGVNLESLYFVEK